MVKPEFIIGTTEYDGVQEGHRHLIAATPRLRDNVPGRAYDARLCDMSGNGPSVFCELPG